MPLYDELKTSFRAIIESAKAKAHDGMTVNEALQLAGEVAQQGMRLVQTTNASGADKKEAVVTVIEQFILEVFIPLDLPGIPNFIIEPAIDAATAKAARPFASMLVEAGLGILKTLGIPGFTK
jgi:hypothetical protein